MTKFNHQQRSGRRKVAKKRKRKPMGLRTVEALVAHRELQYLRNLNKERAAKLKQVKRGKL